MQFAINGVLFNYFKKFKKTEAMTNLIIRRPVGKAVVHNFPYFGNTMVPLFRTSEMPDVPRSVRPAANIVEDDQKFTIELAVPGFDKKDISIEAKENLIIVKGARSQENVAAQNFILKQFHALNFERMFRMPESADLDTIQASLQHGILTLNIQKAQKPEPRKIQIQ